MEVMSDGEVKAVVDTDGNGSPLCGQLVPVAAPVETETFQLPQGWIIKTVLRKRKNGMREEKYHIEPGTGKRFYSIKAVMRHLTGMVTEAPKRTSHFENYYERRVRRKVIPLIADKKYFAGPERKPSRKSSKQDNTARSSGLRKRSPSGGKLMKLDNGKLAVTSHTKAAESSFNLPEGWIVKEVPRINTTKGNSYKIYFEPGTGRRFYSLVSVKKHLAEPDKGKPLEEIFNSGSPVKKLGSKKKTSRKKATSQTCGSTKPPARIKWVITGGDSENPTLSPFIGDSIVQEHMIQLWAERFMVSINGKNCTASNI